jgi:hypothetical protein
MPDVASDVGALAAAWMNDAAQALWTNAILLPYIRSGYRRLQRDLATAGVRLSQGETQITLPAAGTQLDSVGTPPNAQLPADFLWPRKLSEKPSSQQYGFADMRFCPGSLPDRAPASFLVDWRYVGDPSNAVPGVIQFVGATQSVVLKLEYDRSLPNLPATNSAVLIPDALEALAAATVEQVAASRGRAVAGQSQEARYQLEKQTLVDRLKRFEQRYPVRRRPYGSRNRPYFR